jgi:hypothetical protein
LYQITLIYAFVTALFKKFMDHKVYVTPGSEMRCADPGWFRVVFTAPPHVLEEGNFQYKEFVMSVTKKTPLTGIKG